MFGPDMCGVTHKYHFILRFRNPKTGLYNEHHAKTPTEPLDTYFKDKKSHLYTLSRLIIDTICFILFSFLF